MRHALLLPLTCLALAPAAASQTFLGTVSGQSGSQLGAAAVPVGDFDGDGYRDVLAGAPFHAKGAVRLLSGRYLATGAGPDVLFTVSGPTGGQTQGPTEFGAALELLGDWTGDGLEEVAVGAPSYLQQGLPVGAVFLLDGDTFGTLGSVTGEVPGDLGRTLALLVDYTGDGTPELAAASPVAGMVYILRGESFATNGTVNTAAMRTYQGGFGYGSSLAPVFDTFDVDLLIGSPYANSTVGTFQAGYVEWRPTFAPFVAVAFEGTVAGEHFGAAMDVGDDYDGDGWRDYVVGAPDWTSGSGLPEGRVQILSGVLSGQVLREYHGGVSGPNLNATGWRFGSHVSACEDLNGDGVGDYLVGMPDYATQLPLGPGKGGGRIYSGATGDQFIGFTGGNNDRLGDTLVAIDDYDGDGFPEYLIGGSLSDTGGTDSGRVNLYSLYPVPPRTYCSGKPNSLGCTPAVAWSGTASASSAAPFDATCSNVLNNKLGVLFYGFAPAAKPFQGGTKCVANPIKRTPAQSSGGSIGVDDCTGFFAVELNGLIQSGANPALVAGAEVYCQFWSRDPLSSFGSSLSNGLRFVVNP